MEKMLLKLARQLDSLDEASLMALWSKYATITSRFEPSRRWEDACLVFSLIQAKRWKNQLFNYSWSQGRLPPLKTSDPEKAQLPFSFDIDKPQTADSESCRVLAFADGKRVPEADPEKKTPDKDQ